MTGEASISIIHTHNFQHDPYPIHSSHTAPLQFAISSTPRLPQQPIAWDASITVPLPNNTTNQFVPLVAPQPQLPVVHYHQLQLGNGQNPNFYGQQYTTQGGPVPRMLHIHNLGIPQLLPVAGNQGGDIPQTVPVYQPNIPVAPIGGFLNPLGPMNVPQAFCAAHAVGDLGSALCFGRSLTMSSSNLSLIPLLTDSKDWTSWNNAVLGAIWMLGAMGHILDDDGNNDPLLASVHPPELYRDHTPEECTAYLSFWSIDSVVTSVLTACLGKGPVAFIPPINKIIQEKYTACQIYHMLKKRYSNNNYTDSFIQRVQLYSTKYSGGSAEDFIMSWKSGIKRLQQCEFPYIPIDVAMVFTTVIPQLGALWIELC